MRIVWKCIENAVFLVLIVLGTVVLLGTIGKALPKEPPSYPTKGSAFNDQHGF